MYQHTNCLGAECPHCSPFGFAHTEAHEAITSGLRMLQIAEERRMHETAQTLLGGQVTLQTVDVRRGWTDSTGTQVAQYPKRLGVGTTVIILVGTMEERVVLCQKRHDNQHWGFPGGSQNIGESIVNCAIREAKEETGLAIILLGLTSVDSDPYEAGLCTYPDGVVHYTNLTFLARPLHMLPSGQAPEVRCCQESLELRWVAPQNLPVPFMVSHLWRLQKAMAHTGPFLPVR